MILQISNKTLSLAGDSKVVDENNELVYSVKGKFFSPRKAKYIYDYKGELLYIIKNKLFRFFQNYIYIYNSEKEQLGRLTTKHIISRSFIFQGYQEEVLLQAEGFNLNILLNGKSIGYIKNKFTFINDTYQLEIFDEQYKDLCVALVIALDNFSDLLKNND